MSLFEHFTKLAAVLSDHGLSDRGLSGNGIGDNGIRNSALSDSTTSPKGLIELNTVSKSFKRVTLSKRGYSTLKSNLLRAFQSLFSTDASISSESQVGDARDLERQADTEQRDDTLIALSPLTLRIEPGLSLGVIGRNGSGKSTLLKLITGIYQPDEGSVITSGRISALIELGAGFHPDFSGRENVYLGGIMYGLSRAQIDARFGDIVKYAELEDVIDDPVRTYSSGMYMRLGFSLAVHTEPDILIIDEVLAVGDAAFIHRCQETISELKRRGTTMIFVTHDLPSVTRWCDEVIWLESGKVRAQGEPREVIDEYLTAVEEREEEGLQARNAQSVRELTSKEDTSDSASAEVPAESSTKTDLRGEKGRWGSREVEILSVEMQDARAETKWLFHDDEEAVIEVQYVCHSMVEDIVFGIGFIRADGLEVYGCNTEMDDVEVPLPSNEHELPLGGSYRFRLPRIGLAEGSYFLDVAVHRESGAPYDYHHRIYTFSVRNRTPVSGIIAPAHQWELTSGGAQSVKAPESKKFGTDGR